MGLAHRPFIGPEVYMCMRRCGDGRTEVPQRSAGNKVPGPDSLPLKTPARILAAVVAQISEPLEALLTLISDDRCTCLCLQGLYLSVMDALYPINPAALFFIEGCGQTGLGANW